MKQDWRRALRNAVSRNDHRSAMAGAVAGLGGAIAIGVMELFSSVAHYPLAVIPFATSIVLVIGSPNVEPAQPRALIGGHVLSALVGLAVLKLTGPYAWAAAAAVGLAILAMYVTGTFHPPAGINPLLVGQSALDIPARAGAGRRAAADGVLLLLASHRTPPALAAALALNGYAATASRPPRRRPAARNDRRHP
ncbi:HPP family protein [Bradyrhizobium sp. CB3481]|uniref:HPP family protein n=1 Tax=Bradyrhizobium sp. CB3481 TaxID=3039158 RepID=UPI0024B24C32|nr:HPP family protein [Bradyrhizobium sp. CB3481]WFU17876.1 HPP family protein [Bradyrhizobium sp. CB3481]